eukprot:4589102-Pyramimonas_sp.AAC.1
MGTARSRADRPSPCRDGPKHSADDYPRLRRHLYALETLDACARRSLLATRSGHCGKTHTHTRLLLSHVLKGSPQRSPTSPNEPYGASR